MPTGCSHSHVSVCGLLQRLHGAKVWNEGCKAAPDTSGHKGRAAYRSHLGRVSPPLGTGTSSGGLPLPTSVPHPQYGFLPSRGYDKFSRILAFKTQMEENKNSPGHSSLRCSASHPETSLWDGTPGPSAPAHRGRDSQDVAGCHGYLGACSSRAEGQTLQPGPVDLLGPE